MPSTALHRNEARQLWRRSRPARCLVVLVLLACGSLDINCPGAGCDNGLHLMFGSPLEPGTIVSIQADPAFLPWTIVCGVDLICGEEIFYPDYRPKSATVVITTPDGEFEQFIRPIYWEGSGCSAGCFSGSATVELP